jgi:hypothetical protein
MAGLVKLIECDTIWSNLQIEQTAGSSHTSRHVQGVVSG